ncbi:MAG TPA: endonuclease [Rubricoccaceae bacterium]|jgi:hypothetical protein
MRTVYVLALSVALAAPALAQTQTVLFPGQTGAELRASLRAAYRPASRNGDNDDLYAVVDRTTVGGQSGVVCVYTGLFVPFDGMGPNGPTTDPSTDVGNGFSPTGNTINQEHTFPQSQLNGGGSALSEDDLHNLFPTQVGVNADRGNLPFAEIDDALTTRWYRGGPPYTQTTVPASNIDEYSELVAGSRFEPREDHQGNVARAMFYVETMYPEETTDAFLPPQMRTLYAWHYGDPISQADQDRSARVAPFQSSKDNPFVLDSTLIRRAFFPEIVVADEAGPALALAELRTVGANPFRTEGRLELRLVEGAAVRAEAFDALGRRVAVLFDGAAGAGPLRLSLDGAGLAPGVYAVRVVAGGAVLTARLVRAR